MTVTETKTITGPPELVLPPQDTGFRAYTAPGQQRSMEEEQTPVSFKQETDDEDSPTINYERRSGEGIGTIENKVIRRIKEIDDSGKGTMPLLATVVDEEKKENIIDTKKVSTDK